MMLVNNPVVCVVKIVQKHASVCRIIADDLQPREFSMTAIA